MAFTITVQGAQEARRELLELHDRFNRPLTPLLEILGQQVASWAQARIASSGADLAGTADAWPELHPITQAIRRRHGHGGKPKLFRGGQLQHDIRPLAMGSDNVEVGTTIDYGRTVQEGGETDRGGRRRTVQAFPYMLLTEPQVDEVAELVAIYHTDPSATPGEVARA
jgi:phage gpG-like protein